MAESVDENNDPMDQLMSDLTSNIDVFTMLMDILKKLKSSGALELVDKASKKVSADDLEMIVSFFESEGFQDILSKVGKVMFSLLALINDKETLEKLGSFVAAPEANEITDGKISSKAMLLNIMQKVRDKNVQDGLNATFAMLSFIGMLVSDYRAS